MAKGNPLEDDILEAHTMAATALVDDFHPPTAAAPPLALTLTHSHISRENHRPPPFQTTYHLI